jgi:hypothetical protein
MTNAIVLESSTPNQLVVTGYNFNNGGTVQLTLGGTPLIVQSQTDTVLVADLPDSILPGSYILVAWSGNGAVREDSMDITVGAEGPAGPQGEIGPEGPQGPQGLPGADGTDGVNGLDGANCWDNIQGGISTADCIGPKGNKGDKGEPGPEGPQGPAGPPGSDGAPGADGAQGLPGIPGQSVVATALPEGDVNCQYGGTAFESVGGLDYACNGAPGPQGTPGDLALAGLMCPPGLFVIGFDTSGQLVCSSLDDPQTNPPVSYIPTSEGDLLALEFTGDISADIRGAYGDFNLGTATGRIIVDLECASSSRQFFGNGYTYGPLGPLESCFGEWQFWLNSPTGTTQNLSLDSFWVGILWEETAAFPTGFIRFENAGSSENWRFEVLPAQPLPALTPIPAAEFLNNSENIARVRLTIQNDATKDVLLRAGIQTVTYLFSQSAASNCTSGEVRVAECVTVVPSPYLVCQNATRSRTCGAGGWEEWGTCGGEVISDVSGSCP